MSAATVAAYVDRAAQSQAAGETYAAGEWMRAADALARDAFGLDALTVARLRAVILREEGGDHGPTS